MTKWLSTKRLFQLHGWLGLNLGLLLFLVCLSGTCAVFSHEMDWLAEPAMRVDAPASEDRLSWGALYDSVAATFPDATINYISASPDATTAAHVMISHSPADTRWVFVDPYTGRVQGQSSALNLASFFRIFHKQFYILRSDYWPHGRVFVCVFSILLLFSAVTGLLFYKKWWRALVTLRITHSRRVFCSDAHRMLGVWALLFTLLFSVTGLWYLAEQLLGDADIDIGEPVATLRQSLPERGQTLDPKPIDECIAAASAAFPQLQITDVYPPEHPGQALVVQGQAEALIVDEQANQVYVDPYTAEVLLVRRGTDAAIGHRLIHTANPLHFGRFGGLTTKIIWTVAGALISIGVLSGAIIWWLRVSRGDNRLFRKNPLSTLVMSTLTVAVLVLTVQSTIDFIGNQLAGPAQWQRPTPVDRGTIGPWSATVRHAGPPVDGKLDVSLAFDRGAHANFKAARMWIGQPDDAVAAVKARRTVAQLQAKLAVPAATADARICVEIDQWDGTQSAASFALPASMAASAPSGHAVAGPTVPPGVKLVVALFSVVAASVCLLWLVWVR